MKVKDVMVTKVITVKTSDDFHSIINVLIKHKISGLPVLDEDEKIRGIISEKDLLGHLFPEEQEFYSNMEYWTQPGIIEEEAAKISNLKAEHIMTRQVISVDPEDTIMHACALVIINNVRRLPVVKDNKVVGIVTTRKLYNKFLKNLKK